MNLQEIEEILRQGEGLEREFKSDARRGISDNEIYEEVVALANTGGGALLIGVEDDGQVTGARPRHQPRTDNLRLQSAIFNNTVPNINTRISMVSHADGEVLAIQVHPYPEPCATAQGKSVHRTIGPDGKPQTVPFYPHDQRSRRVDLGLLDFSSQTMEGVSFNELDPLEFERLKQIVKRLHGDQQLLSLPNTEIAKALKLVESEGENLKPNISGILLLGKEDLFSSLVPTHSVHFQVIDAKGEVRVNDTFRWPLLRTLEEIERRFRSRNEEREVMSGLFRIPIPDYSEQGVREAINNAVLHRDFSKLESTYFQWHPDHILITNPGGFPEGVTIDNLLVHEPKPRNPRLAEAFKRIGLIEQTGRGVDRIFLGQLRYGRPIPDYSRSDDTGVRVVLRGGDPSLRFAEFVYEQEKTGPSLNLDELLVLNALHFERRIDSETAGRLIQKGISEGRAVLERLHERGMVEGKGQKRGRTYHLAASLYKRFQMESEYVRAKGFAPHQHEQMVLEYAKTHGKITRSQTSDLCHISPDQAYRLLRGLCEKHPEFEMIGKKRAAFYRWNEKNA